MKLGGVALESSYIVAPRARHEGYWAMRLCSARGGYDSDRGSVYRDPLRDSADSFLAHLLLFAGAPRAWCRPNTADMGRTLGVTDLHLV